MALCKCSIVSDLIRQKSKAENLNCQAQNEIGAQIMGCSNEVGVLPDGNIDLNRVHCMQPYKALCSAHIAMLHRHWACPACAIFCLKGSFYVCSASPSTSHYMHKECVDNLQLVECLHCASDLTTNTRYTHVHLMPFVIRETERQPPFIELKRLNRIEATDQKMNRGQQILEDAEQERLSAAIQTVTDRSFKPKKYSELHAAVLSDDLPAVCFLLKKGFNPNTTVDLDDNSSLHLALQKNDYLIIYALIRAGADLHQPNDSGQSPLFQAVCNQNQLRIIKLMLHYGADLTKLIQISDLDGVCPADYKCNIEYCTLLHALVLRNTCRQTIALVLARCPALINQQDSGGRTVLMWLCSVNDVDYEMFHLLLTYSPDLTLVDFQKMNNIAHYIVGLKHQKTCKMCIQLLVEHDAELMKRLLRSTNSECRSAMSIAEQLYSDNIELINFLRLHSAEELSFEQDISQGRERIAISLVSSPCSSMLALPHNFQYLPRAFHLSLEFAPEDNRPKLAGKYLYPPIAPEGCACVGQCNSADCSCVAQNEDSLPFYKTNGRIRKKAVIPDRIFHECGVQCACSVGCGNRQAQHAPTHKLQIRPASKHKGYALHTLEDIARRNIIIEYTGELVSSSEIDDRADDTYVFDAPEACDLFCLDAHDYGNASRFMNHSCHPNMSSVRIRWDNMALSHIFFFSTRDILANEELTFDYGAKYWAAKSVDRPCRDGVQEAAIFCLCGSETCKYSRPLVISTTAHV